MKLFTALTVGSLIGTWAPVVVAQVVPPTPTQPMTPHTVPMPHAVPTPHMVPTPHTVPTPASNTLPMVPIETLVMISGLEDFLTEQEMEMVRTSVASAYRTVLHEHTGVVLMTDAPPPATVPYPPPVQAPTPDGKLGWRWFWEPAPPPVPPPCPSQYRGCPGFVPPPVPPPLYKRPPRSMDDMGECWLCPIMDDRFKPSPPRPKPPVKPVAPKPKPAVVPIPPLKPQATPKVVPIAPLRPSPRVMDSTADSVTRDGDDDRMEAAAVLPLTFWVPRDAHLATMLGDTDRHTQFQREICRTLRESGADVLSEAHRCSFSLLTMSTVARPSSPVQSLCVDGKKQGQAVVILSNAIAFDVTVNDTQWLDASVTAAYNQAYAALGWRLDAFTALTVAEAEDDEDNTIIMGEFNQVCTVTSSVDHANVEPTVTPDELLAMHKAFEEALCNDLRRGEESTFRYVDKCVFRSFENPTMRGVAVERPPGEQPLEIADVEAIE